jgi:hypothetical protein
MAANVPYLKYLQNLRESPNKYSASKAAPTKGIVSKPMKGDLEVYDDDPYDGRNEYFQSTY